MRLECSPEELLQFMQLLREKPETKRSIEPIAGLTAVAPSKEMQDYMQTVQDFVFSHSVSADGEKEKKPE